MNSELVIRYDDQVRPVSAQCSGCGQQMPAPPPTLQDSADIIQWFSVQFIEHKKRNHPTPPYGADK
jgi:hypothetical protein